MRNKDFLLLQSSCSFFIGFCSSFDSLQNTQILYLFVFILRPFLCRSRCALLSRSFSYVSSVFLKPSAVFVWYCSLIAPAETVLPYLKETTFFRKHVSLFNCSRKRIDLLPKTLVWLHCKSLHQSVLLRLHNAWHLSSGGCHAFLGWHIPP